MAFAFLQSLSVEQNLDADDESDIEVGEMSDDEEQDDDQDSSSLDLANSGEDWTDVLVDVTDKLEPFSEFSGPLHDLPTDSQPLDYFKLFFPIDILERMVTETNRYAEQQQQLKGARDAYWKPATFLTSENISILLSPLDTMSFQKLVFIGQRTATGGYQPSQMCGDDNGTGKFTSIFT